MTRQVMMVFFGEAHWQDRAGEHGAHGDTKPHESPWIMLFPLVVLAALSTIGGIIQLPDVMWIPDVLKEKLGSWLAPVVDFGETSLEGTWADEHITFLMLIASAGAILGIVVAWLVYQRRRVKAVEPAILLHGWYYDDAVTEFMGGPGRVAFEDAAWFDQQVIDGAVNGSAKLVRGTATEVRKTESGYVRAYAGIIGLGAVLLLGWFVVFRGIL
jgi:NADH-quinone oxidoreductase subunit L